MKEQIAYQNLSLAPFAFFLFSLFFLLGCTGGMKSQMALQCSAKDTAPRVLVDGPSALSSGRCTPLRVQVGFGSLEVGEGDSACDRQPFLAMPAANDLFVDLVVSEKNAEIFEDAGCSKRAARVVVPKGESQSKLFYVRPKKAPRQLSSSQREPVTLVASEEKNRLQSDLYEMELSSATVSGLRISGPQKIEPGDCVKYTLQSTDGAGNRASLKKDVEVSLESIGTEGGGHIFRDSACRHSKSEIQIPSGKASSVFYFRYNKKNKVHLMTFENAYSAALKPAKLTVYVLSKND